MRLMEDLHTDINDMQQDIVQLSTHDKSAASKIELLLAIVVKEHKIIANLFDSYVNVTRQLMQNEFVILNLAEKNNEDIIQAAKYAVNAAGIMDEIDYETAYRKGAERRNADTPRPVVVRLHRRDVVESI